MKPKNETELVDWIYTMHLQNLSGREDFTESFKQGITATIKELRELKLFDLHGVTQRSEPVCPVCRDKGYYTYGGSFGGPVMTQRCSCGANGG